MKLSRSLRILVMIVLASFSQLVIVDIGWAWFGEKIVREVKKAPKTIRKEWNQTREKHIDKFGDKIEAEARRTREHVKEAAKKVEKETKRAAKRVDKLIKEIEGEVYKLKDVKTKVKKLKREIKRAGKDLDKEVKKVDEKLSKAIEKAKSLDKDTIVRIATLKVLEDEIRRAADRGMIEDFLNMELIDHVRIFDVLYPIQGLIEHIDPTGITQCTRESSMKDMAKKPTADPGAITEMVRDNVIECIVGSQPELGEVIEYVESEEGDTSSGVEEIKAETEVARRELEKNEAELVAEEERLRLKEKYEKQVTEDLKKQRKIASKLKGFKERLDKINALKSELFEDMDEDLDEIGEEA